MDRADVSPESVAVMLPIPHEIAEHWPEVPGNGEPHVTCIYVGQLSHEDADDIAMIVAQHTDAIVGELITLGELGYFDNDQRVAYVAVEVSSKLRAARNRILADIEAAGFVPDQFPGPWTPHATLAYNPPGADYLGEVPTGSWQTYCIELWRGDARLRIRGSRPMTDAERIDFDARARARKLALAEAESIKATGPNDATRSDFKVKIKVTVEDENEDDGDGEELEELEHDRDYDEDEDEGEQDDLEWRWSPDVCPLHAERSDSGSWIWRTQRDDLVRETHAALDGKEFENGEAPEIGEPGEEPNCRCYKEYVPTIHAGREEPTKKQKAAAKRATANAKRVALEAAAKRAAKREAARSDRSQRAPAVHTESRVHVAEVMRADRAELLPPEVQANGWRRYPVLYSRAEIIQEYDGIREYRARDDVFARASRDSGVGVPWELRHSSDLLTPETVLGVSRGAVLSVDVHTDGLHTCGNAIAWDRELFDAIGEPGDDELVGWAPEVSVAYRCKVDFRPGTTADGQPFDQRQYGIVWNSLASEPKGRAQTARVLSDRLDAKATVITGADAMLALVAAGRPRSRPVYYDIRSWARFDSARHTQPQSTTRKDNAPMYNLIQMLAAAAGVTEADLAAKLGVAEADLPTMLAGELTPEQLTILTTALGPVPAPAAAPEAAPAAAPPAAPAAAPAPDAAAAAPAADPNAAGGESQVVIGDAPVAVAPEVAAHIASLEEQIAATSDRADRADAKTRSMVTRADAEALAIDTAEAMALAHRTFGFEFRPAKRKDSAGNECPITCRDWQIAAINGAFGDRAPAMLTRIDAAPSTTQPHLIRERLLDAKEYLDAKAHKTDEVISSINRSRTSAADRADGGEVDPFVAADQRRAELAAGKTITTPTANGAA